MQKEQAENDLQFAIDHASVDEYSTLEKLVAMEMTEDNDDIHSVSSAVSHHSALSHSSMIKRGGAGRNAVSVANSRLMHLKATKKEHERIQDCLTTASAASDMEGVERAMSEADEIGFANPKIEQGRVLLTVMHDEQRVSNEGTRTRF